MSSATRTPIVDVPIEEKIASLEASVADFERRYGETSEATAAKYAGYSPGLTREIAEWVSQYHVLTLLKRSRQADGRANG